MSSLSAAEPARTLPALPEEGVRALALAGLALYAVANQLDAVANWLSAHLPVSIVQLSVAAPIAGAMLILGARPPAPLSAPARAMLGLLAWAMLSWTLCAHPSAGLAYLVKLATAILPALAAMAIVRTPRDLAVTVWAVMLASAASAAIVLVEAHTHTRLVATSLAATTADFDGVARSSGGSDQNATTAAQMVMTGFALAAGWAAARGPWRAAAAAIALLALAALALMSARSAILGAGVAAGLVLLSWRRARAFPLLLAGAAGAAAVALMFAPPTLTARFEAIGDFGMDPTLFRRVTYLRIGLDLLSQSPLWGIGPGNFPLYYVGDAYRWMPGRELVPRELHNTYLDVATELGLVGALLFGGIALAALVAAARAAGGAPAIARPGYAVALALAALLVGCAFMPHKDMRYLWLIVALALRAGAMARA